ncbi:MAG: C40 family peptidase [Ignavibacteriaceae bacterium]
MALFFLSLISPIYSQQNMNMDNIQKIIAEIKQRFAPDKRTALFNVSYKLENEKEVALFGETNLLDAKEALIKDLKQEGYKLKDSIEVLPGNEFGDNTYGVVDVSVASLRTKPDQAAELATQALLGSMVKLLKKSQGWVLVQTPDKYIAWMEPDNYQQMNKAQIAEWDSSQRIIFTKEYGFCYSKKNVNSNPVSDLVAGNLLKEVERDSAFVKIEFPDKRTGYIPVNNCEDYTAWLNSRQLTGENIISTAKKFMGIPYLWGGTSAKIMDCSGFTRTVFLLNGIFLPRDASQQVNVGIPVDTKNGFSYLKPGDLLFFGEKATSISKEKITHVGIYIGNEEFIHESGMVKINSFDKTKKNYSGYRHNQFVRAKRILNSAGKNGVELLKNIQY